MLSIKEVDLFFLRIPHFVVPDKNLVRSDCPGKKDARFRIHRHCRKRDQVLRENQLGVLERNPEHRRAGNDDQHHTLLGVVKPSILLKIQ